MWAYGRGQTDRQTHTHTHRRMWPQYISRRLRLTQTVINIVLSLHIMLHHIYLLLKSSGYRFHQYYIYNKHLTSWMISNSRWSQPTLALKLHRIVSIYIHQNLHITNSTTTTTTILRPFFLDHPGEPVPEENFWTLCNKGKLTAAETPKHRNTSGAGHHSIQTNQCPPPPSHFLQAGCPSCRPTNIVKALKATSALRLGRRR